MGSLEFDQVSLIGYGNVGSHLFELLNSSGINVAHLLLGRNNLRSMGNLDVKAKIISSVAELPKDQLVIICVNDTSIVDVINEIDPEIPIAYTSGSVSLKNVAERENIGVFYPLQTFSKGLPLTVKEFPILIEANNKDFESSLKQLAHRISNTVMHCNSEERGRIHEAAVWVNNFTNHIIHLGEARANDNQIDFSIYKPLLEETILKLNYTTAKEAQTGPARRGDNTIIDKQSQRLTGMEAEIYKLLSQSIINTYKNYE